MKQKPKPVVSPVMRELSEYMAAARRKALPSAVIEKTKHHIADTVGAMISGTDLIPGRKAIAYVRSLGGTREAGVMASRIVTSMANAALANGMLAHADETDDSHAASLTHPGCGVVPAALAVGEHLGVSGMALVRAVALGYDVCARLTLSLNPYEFLRDGHSTHGFGPNFGAAAAAAALARLDARRMRYVLSYAAQQAAGISCWVRDEEHIEKAFDFGGLPARNGVTAAAMVAHGCTGVDDVFSGERNFFVAYGRAPQPEELVRELGLTYEVINTNIKRWPVGSPIQAPLDSLDVLIRQHGIRADDVERVVVRVAHHSANTVNNRDIPDICMQHMCAVMLVDGTVSFASAHDHKRMRDPRVLAVRKRIELVGDDELQKIVEKRQGIVEMRLNNGRELRHHTTAVRGTAGNPMTREEVDAKSYDLTKDILGARKARRLCDAIWHIEKLKDVREMRTLYQA